MELIILTIVVITGIVLGAGATWATVHSFERGEGNAHPKRAAWRLLAGKGR